MNFIHKSVLNMTKIWRYLTKITIPLPKKNFDNVSGMLKNDFAYEVNGFCTRFANYFFAISLQDRQIVISSQFKKLERLVSHTNIFKTCSIGDGENVLKIHSKEKKVHHKKIMLIFFSSFWKKAHDLNDDVPLYCESLVFATTPKSRKVVCKKSINHGTTMNKCFKKVKTWARGYFVPFSQKQKLHTDSQLNSKNKKNRRNKKWKKILTLYQNYIISLHFVNSL